MELFDIMNILDIFDFDLEVNKFKDFINFYRDI
jgi:hypothetical protein